MQIGTFARNMEQVEFAIENKADFVDLRMDIDYSLDMPTVRKMLSKAGISYTLHLPSDPDWKPQDLAQDIVPYIDLGREIGADLVTFHTSLSTLFYSDEEIDAFLSRLPAVCEAIAGPGVSIAIETLGLYYTELTLLFAAHPRIRMALDLGHGQIMAKRNRALGHIEAFSDKIAMVIVHDNHGDKMVDEVLELRKSRAIPITEMRESAHRYDSHLPIGDGSIDFVPLFRALKECNYDGRFLMMCEDYTRFPNEREKFLDLWLQA
jgi:sugar phosphate isomerase/epimerase